MLRMILARHAKTERDSPSGMDHDRRLDERGRNDALMIGEWLAAHDPPDQVLVSSATRARQTWDGMSTALPQAAAEIVDGLYHADAGDIIGIMHNLASRKTRCLMIVGHNPGLHELALGLTASGEKEAKRLLEDNLPTAGMALLDFDSDTWDDVSFRRGRLVRFVSPKLLRETPERL